MFRMLQANAKAKRSESPELGSAKHIEECATLGIRDVWASNMEEEFIAIRNLIRKYPYVAMDTEYPGIVARPKGEFRDHNDYKYQEVRCNVDLLSVIQVGFSFMDEQGNSPQPVSTWQFNFKFNIEDDMYAQDSIELLQNCGIQFKRHEDEGILVQNFAELLITSGVVLMDNVKWLSFHSCYDFGYMLKVLTNQQMPPDEQEFFELLNIYFPNIYDIKYLLKFTNIKGGGLQDLANQLDIRRVGPQHQAGSDSLLTGRAFFKMREVHFNGIVDDEKYRGKLYGLSELHGSSLNGHYTLPVVTDLPSTEPVSSITEQTLTDPAVTDSSATNAVPDSTDSSSLAVKEPQHVSLLDAPVGDSGYEASLVTDVDVIGGDWSNGGGGSDGTGDASGLTATTMFKPPVESKPRLFCRKA